MDYSYVNKYNAVMQELRFSSHVDMFIRVDSNKRFDRACFVFNLYHFPDGLWKPLYLCYVNDIKQIGYTDSGWHQSDEVHRAQEARAKICDEEYCYCKPSPHHSFEIDNDKVKRYFELVVDVGDVVDGKHPIHRI